MSRFLCVVVLLLLAVLHSLLGERKLLRPLFAAGLPQGALPLGRAFTERTLRFTWHLLSVAWVSLAALVAGAVGLAFTFVGPLLPDSSAAALVVCLVRQIAWALFTLAGAAGLLEPRIDAVGPFAAGLAAALLAALAALHLAWGLGLRWGIHAAIPEVAGRPAFRPPRSLTALVAAALGVAAALIVVAVRCGAAWSWLSLAVAGVFALRALGDFRFVGLTKSVYGTAFARWDDGLFTPLSILLAMCFAIVGARGLL